MASTINPPTAPPASTGSSSGLNFSVPLASDLPSALNAIRLISQYMNTIAQLLTSLGLTGNPGTFNVTQQVFEDVTITDPNDSSVSVTVSQCTKLVLVNAKTGEVWTWTLPTNS